MYFYTFSSGAYSDFNEVTIMKKEKVSREDFIKMYNEVVTYATGGEEGIAEAMCEKFGFEELDYDLGIHASNGGFEPIKDEDDIKGDHLVIDSPQKWCL